MADLAVDLCGFELRNPLILASGPLSSSAAGIRAAFAAGAAAVVTKTIRPEASANPVPHIAAAGRGSLLNTEGWSDLSAEQWIERELPDLSDREGVLIASTGHTPGEVQRLARPLAEAGADMLELVSYRAEDAAPMVAAAKKAVSIPVLIKVNGSWPDLLEVVGACLEAGADGITAIDSVGPALRIDVETGRPMLGSLAWLSGQAILPIALGAVARISLRHPVPVVGTGGVGEAEDAIEMIMAGAAAVAAHTAPLLRGLGWFARTRAALERWLEGHDVARLADLRGRGLRRLREPLSYAPLRFRFDEGLCTRCEQCIHVCAYQARHLTPEGDMLLGPALCHSCGLCASVCPTGALSSDQPSSG
ncbi:MAG: 4Fe-4S binding protein [Anaerolineae bacterium]|nr:4Fe-4S binding protein [Anaerolineae bacterium]